MRRREKSPAVAPAGRGRESQASQEFSTRTHSTTGKGSCKATPIHDHKGRVVGVVEGVVFKKRVRESVHMLRRPRGWAFDVVSLQEAVTAGADSIEIYDKESRTAYRCTMNQLKKHGFELDRGRGQQFCLPLKWWAKDGKPVGEQLPMFVGVV